MKLHRNTPKRFYSPGGIFAITTNTINRYPYFNNEILCHLLIQEINLCTIIHNVYIYACKINPEHLHLLIKPYGKTNYSQFMFSFKKNFSYDANLVLGFNSYGRGIVPSMEMPPALGAQPVTRLARGKKHISIYNHELSVQLFRDMFIQKHGIDHTMPRYAWQKSYYIHRITDDHDFINQLRYIEKQYIKHGLEKNKWCFVVDHAVFDV